MTRNLTDDHSLLRITLKKIRLWLSLGEHFIPLGALKLLDILASVMFSMQRDPVVSKASELLRLGLMPSPSELRNGKVIFW
jgi:hypothetical protein